MKDVTPGLLANLPMGFPESHLMGGKLVENSGSNHKILLLAIYDFVINMIIIISLYSVVDLECLEMCR